MKRCDKALRGMLSSYVGFFIDPSTSIVVTILYY